MKKTLDLIGDDKIKSIAPIILAMSVLFSVFVVLAHNALAQTLVFAPAALEDLIEEALENNNALKSTAETIDSYRKKIVSEGALSDPMLGVSLLNLPSTSLKFDQEPMTQKQIFLSQKLPWPGKLQLKARTMELAANRLSFIHQSQKLNLAKDIAIAYYELAFIADNITLNKKLSELMELILSSANTQYASGRGLQKNIFQTQIEISTLADEAIQLNKKYRVIENTIHALLNRTEYKAIRPPENIDLPMDEFPVEIFQKKALTNNPKVKALYLEIEQNSIMAKFAEKNIYPDVDLRLAYSQRDDDPSGNTRDDFVSLSATLNLPVWKHSRQDREIMSKKAEERSAANKYHDLLATLPLKIDALITEIKSAQKSYHLTQTLLIPQAINWSKASVSDYEVGKTGFSTMINARVQPLRFKLKARRYLFDIYQNKARLDALTGGISKE